mmetsp:Transcript_56871/g.157455  ORF Transcript_56871/g.157455 Transcript_56871/m.157455 type:complete len:423 (+) Transcript_56871:71-1339(+)
MQLPSLVSALRQRAAKVAALTLLSAVVGSRAVGMSRPLVRRQASPLQAALQEVLAGDAAKHILAVEESVRPTYEALPKNAQGQIPPEDVFPAVVRSYFAKEHGWVVRGFEPPLLVANSTAVHSAEILGEKAPGVAAALQAMRRSGHGLALSDVVGTIAAIEHLVVEDSVGVLAHAYAANGLETAAELGEADLHEVLRSYLLLFRYSEGAEVDQQDLARKYGKWQDAECLDMKSTLMRLGGAPGLAPFEAFRKEPDHGTYQFREGAGYLAATGILQAGEAPQVRIANYLLGPSNCIAPSRYYTVCCLNDCERLLGDVEAQVRRPAPTAEALLAAVRPASEAAEALRRLASAGEGLVPLHSSAFREWLHGAFPNDCPLPTSPEAAAEDAELASASRWLWSQEACTRLPEWHPLSASVADSVLEV